MEKVTEIEVRDLAENAIWQLRNDNRFLAFVDYLEFIYEDLKEDYEFKTERDELASRGQKVMLRTLLSYIKENTEIDKTKIEETDITW